MLKKWLDDDGFLRGFRYHDGSLDGLLIQELGAVACLAIRSVDDEQRIITLRQVSALHVDAFREGNIINNLRALRSDQLQKDEGVARWLADRLDLAVAKVPADRLVFVLESSYGASVVAVIGEFEVSELGTTLAVLPLGRAATMG